YRPRHPLHRDSATATIYPPRCIEEKHSHAPQRHEAETTLRQPIVARSTPATARAFRPTVGPRADLHLQRGSRLVLAKSNRPVHERLVPQHAIEDSLKEHPVLAPEWIDFVQTHPYRRSRQDAIFLQQAIVLHRSREQGRGKGVGSLRGGTWGLWSRPSDSSPTAPEITHKFSGRPTLIA